MNEKNYKLIVGLVVGLCAALTACGIFVGRIISKKKFIKSENHTTEYVD